jgi:hypothetical protein
MAMYEKMCCSLLRMSLFKYKTNISDHNNSTVDEYLLYLANYFSINTILITSPRNIEKNTINIFPSLYIYAKKTIFFYYKDISNPNVMVL